MGNLEFWQPYLAAQDGLLGANQDGAQVNVAQRGETLPKGGQRQIAVARGAFLCRGRKGIALIQRCRGLRLGFPLSLWRVAMRLVVHQALMSRDFCRSRLRDQRVGAHNFRTPRKWLTPYAKTNPALAPSGVNVLETQSDTGLFMMRARDTVVLIRLLLSKPIGDLSFAARGFSVSARLNAFSGQPISASGGFETLKSLADQIKADNGVSETETVAAVSKPKTTTGGVKLPGLFGKIFRRN